MIGVGAYRSYLYVAYFIGTDIVAETCTPRAVGAECTSSCILLISLCMVICTLLRYRPYSFPYLTISADFSAGCWEFDYSSNLFFQDVFAFGIRGTCGRSCDDYSAPVIVVYLTFGTVFL